MIRRRRKQIVEELNPDEFKIDVDMHIKDDITFLRAVDMYLLKLYRIRNGIDKGNEEELKILNFLKEKISRKIEGESIAPDSFIERIIKKFNLRYDEVLILSALLLHNAMSKGTFVSQYLSKLGQGDDDIIENIINPDYCRLTDMQALIGADKIVNDESTVKRLVESGLIDINYSTRIKLCGRDIRVKLSSVLMELFNSDEDEAEESYKLLSINKLKEDIEIYSPIREEGQIKDIINEIDNFLKLREKTDIAFEPPRIVLTGENNFELDIISKVIASTFKRDLFVISIDRIFTPYFRHLEHRFGNRIPLDRKVLKLLIINDYILRIDINTLSILDELDKLFEQYEDYLKKFNSAIIITYAGKIGNRLDELSISKDKYKFVQVDRFSGAVKSNILERITRYRPSDFNEIINEGNYSLKDIEVIGKMALRMSIINGEPMSDRLLKKAKDNLFLSLKGEAQKRFENVRIEDTKVVIEYEIKERLNDVVLNSDIKTEIANIILAIKNQNRLYSEILNNVSYGKGIKVLFFGNPGTGKTLTTRAIAGETEKGLITVNLAQLMDKYVGETEKNIHNHFRIATETNSILFIDEADSLIMNRDKLIRSFEFSFINTLLKEIENYDGVLILSTNYEEIRDRAINRRIHFFVKYENPDYENRILLIKRLIPEKYIADLNIEEIASVPFNGGHLKNVWIKAGIAILRGGKIETGFFITELNKEIEKENQKVDKKVGF